MSYTTTILTHINHYHMICRWHHFYCSFLSIQCVLTSMFGCALLNMPIYTIVHLDILLCCWRTKERVIGLFKYTVASTLNDNIAAGMSNAIMTWLQF